LAAVVGLVVVARVLAWAVVGLVVVQVLVCGVVGLAVVGVEGLEPEAAGLAVAGVVRFEAVIYS
jgi:hypothetical protein